VTALKGRDLRLWRAGCAMIFQQFNLVNRLNILTNVLIGRLSYHWTVPSLLQCFSAAERAQAIRALARLDILPQALQRADTLSGGQQQPDNGFDSQTAVTSWRRAGRSVRIHDAGYP
jgi:phosphonate transport system ATP-binding protein